MLLALTVLMGEGGVSCGVICNSMKSGIGPGHRSVVLRKNVYRVLVKFLVNLAQSSVILATD
jgi:hypothetical protein